MKRVFALFAGVALATGASMAAVETSPQAP